MSVEGKVLLGDEELASTLWFGGRYGEVRVEVESDDEGRFEVVLPRDGDWKVDVFSEQPLVSSHGIEVLVPRPRGSGKSEVLIQLPDTIIHGIVVDEEHIPASEVPITLLGPHQHAFVQSDSSGRFEIRGQEPGTYTVDAKAGDKAAEPVTVTVMEGFVPPPIRLVLRQRRRVFGKVVSAAGPVARALILGLPITTQAGMASVAAPQVYTRVDGSFELDVPGSSTSVRLLVLARGYALHLSMVSTSASEPVLLSLTREAGVLKIPQSVPSTDGERRFSVVQIGAQPIDALILIEWARMNESVAADNGEISIPAMPPGHYGYCEVGMAEGMLMLGGLARPAAGACLEGYLAPGGELVFAPPRE